MFFRTDRQDLHFGSHEAMYTLASRGVIPVIVGTPIIGISVLERKRRSSISRSSTFPQSTYSSACIEDVLKFGIYYSPAWKHYGDTRRSVTCDMCNKRHLYECYGYGDKDLCKDCYKSNKQEIKISNQQNVSIQDVLIHGSHYSSASSRYTDSCRNIMCNMCNKTHLQECYGYGDKNLCITCYYKYKRDS